MLTLSRAPSGAPAPAAPMAELDWSGQRLVALPWQTIMQHTSSSLTTVDVSDNDIVSLLDGRAEAAAAAGSLPESPALRLSLSRNRLKGLRGIGSFPRLQDLTVSHNDLRSLRFVEQLPHLRALDVSHNPLTSLDGLERSPKLLHACASGCAIETVPCLKHCSRLRSLDLSGNRIARLGDVPRALPARLSSLRLDGNRVEDLHELKSLAALTVLIRLDIQGNPFEVTTRGRSIDVRPFLAFLLPSARSLDGRAVSPAETSAARALFTDAATGEVSDVKLAMLRAGRQAELLAYLSDRCPASPEFRNAGSGFLRSLNARVERTEDAENLAMNAQTCSSPSSAGPDREASASGAASKVAGFAGDPPAQRLDPHRGGAGDPWETVVAAQRRAGLEHLVQQNQRRSGRAEGRPVSAGVSPPGATTVQALMADALMADALMADAPRADAPRAASPVSASPIPEVADAPVADAPVAAAPMAAAPMAAAPMAVAPMADRSRVTAVASAPAAAGQGPMVVVPARHFARLQKQVAEMRKYFRVWIKQERLRREAAATRLQAAERGRAARREHGQRLRDWRVVQAVRRPQWGPSRAAAGPGGGGGGGDGGGAAAAASGKSEIPESADLRRRFPSHADVAATCGPGDGGTRESLLPAFVAYGPAAPPRRAPVLLDGFDGAAAAIQSRWRGVRLRDRMAHAHELRGAAMRVQAAWRGRSVRATRGPGFETPAGASAGVSNPGAAPAEGAAAAAAAAAAEVLRVVQAEVKAQAAELRGLAQQQRTADEALRMLWAETARLRTWADRVTMRERQRAATVLQTRWRGASARRRHGDAHAEARAARAAAAGVIQAAHRRRSGCAALDRAARAEAAALLVQTHARTLLVQNKFARARAQMEEVRALKQQLEASRRKQARMDEVVRGLVLQVEKLAQASNDRNARQDGQILRLTRAQASQAANAERLATEAVGRQMDVQTPRKEERRWGARKISPGRPVRESASSL